MQCTRTCTSRTARTGSRSSAAAHPVSRLVYGQTCPEVWLHNCAGMFLEMFVEVFPFSDMLFFTSMAGHIFSIHQGMCMQGCKERLKKKTEQPHTPQHNPMPCPSRLTHARAHAFTYVASISGKHALMRALHPFTIPSIHPCRHTHMCTGLNACMLARQAC